MAVSQAVARPVRTGVQGGVGWVVAEFIDAFLWNMDERQYGILIVLVTMVAGWIQVLAENHFGKAFLREIPEPPAPPADEV